MSELMIEDKGNKLDLLLFQHALGKFKHIFFRLSFIFKLRLMLGNMYRVFIKYCVFPQNVVIFLNSVSSAAALVFYLPFSGSSDPHTKGKPREAKVRNIIFKIFEKNTIFNEHSA